MAESENTTKTRYQRGMNPNSLANLQAYNPKGRPKQPKEFKELVKTHTVAALEAVIAIMQDKTAKPTDRLRACELIIDRAYGKAAQPIVGDDDHGAIQVDLFNPEQRKARIDELIAKYKMDPNS
ncbi:hypothetical protein [Acetonema longum]|uniref:DUF5681 domain-containing protein n=1 Tax=Acetonema longum DSM 6540 TaxID=1009370 RepID=F7NEI4_9FIRM|nr:hypothetical protein [Acetonema longum]EGO65395.1 hypothetical protein ALO_02236 [Acetonema longum DSM 6540]